MKISKVVGGGPGQIPLRALSPRSGFRPFPTKTDDVAPPVWRGILALKHLKASATLCRNCEIHSIPDATLTDLHGHGRRLFSGLRNGAYVHSNTRLLFVSTPRAPIDPAKFPPPPLLFTVPVLPQHASWCPMEGHDPQVFPNQMSFVFEDTREAA